MWHGRPSSAGFGEIAPDPYPAPDGVAAVHARQPPARRMPEHSTLIYVRDAVHAMFMVVAVPVVLWLLWRRRLGDVARAVVR